MAKQNEPGSARRESPRSAARILHILDSLAENPGGWTLAALSRELETPKSSLLVLLRALTDLQHVAVNNGTYHLGIAAFKLASKIEAKRIFPAVARPILRRIVSETGETAVIGAISEDGLSTVYIDKIESDRALRFSANIGAHRPLYCSASGLVILAFQPKEKTEQYLKSIKLRQLTSNTIVSKRELQDAISKARKEGVAVTRDQATEGVTGFGAPILDGAGHLIATLVLAAPSIRSETRMDLLRDLARNGALEISEIMGANSEMMPPPIPR